FAYTTLFRSDGGLLRPVDDVGHHRAGGEVLEVEDLLVAAGVGDLEEPVVVGGRVQALDHRLGHRGDRGLRVAAVAGELLGVDGQVRGEVLAQDLPGAVGVRALDADLHIEPAGAQDRRV